MDCHSPWIATAIPPYVRVSPYTGVNLTDPGPSVDCKSPWIVTAIRPPPSHVCQTIPVHRSYSDSPRIIHGYSLLYPPHVRVSPYIRVTLTVPGPSVDCHSLSIATAIPPPPPPYVRVSPYTRVNLTDHGRSGVCQSNRSQWLSMDGSGTVRVTPVYRDTLTYGGRGLYNSYPWRVAIHGRSGDCQRNFGVRGYFDMRGYSSGYP